MHPMGQMFMILRVITLIYGITLVLKLAKVSMHLYLLESR